MRSFRWGLLALVVVLLVPTLARGQTSSTAAVTGTVSDPTGAVIPAAEVELMDTSTNATRRQHTNEQGQYTFASVPPGTYRVSVTVMGFKKAVRPSVKVDVSRAYNINFVLEVGDVASTIEVKTGTEVELQTLDASVGNEIRAEHMAKYPSLGRDATALLLFQPMATPGRGESNTTGGQVAGARNDQNTFMLDGGDSTSNTEGSGGYNTGQSGEPRAVVPTPIESLEEFRVTTNNPNATFGRASGGQVAMVTKRGTNDIHGSVYWYHQNDNLNANTWTRNRLGQEKPEEKDHRFGFTLGGPVWKDRTFLFGHYEGRRKPSSTDILRLVPTSSLRAGNLTFTDLAGNDVTYNVATSTACGPMGGLACDPRGLGLSSVVDQVWQLLPPGNSATDGDGLNTTGFRAALPLGLREEFAVVRLDHKITENWNLMSSFRYGHTERPSSSQIDIGGLACGSIGEPCSTRQDPLEPRYLVLGLSGQITPNITNDFRFNWLRHWWEWAAVTPTPQVAGTAGALAIAGEGLNTFVDEPINVDTQNSRSRVWSGHDYVVSNNTSWLAGRHTVQFGGRYTDQRVFHSRNDKVVGSLTALVYQLTDGTGLNFPATFRPPTCDSTMGILTNCIQSGDVSRWNTLYAGLTGIVDTAAVLVTRDGDLNPNPPGTSLRENVKVKAYELYVSDIWRVNPSLTLSYGLTWNAQMPPREAEGKQTLAINNATGEIIDTRSYLRSRRDAALAGQIFNPEIGYLPINETGRKYPYDPDWNNFGPRVAAAWNPSFTDGFLGAVFGDRKSVLRGGYSLTYDRINGVGIVMVPILGVGFGQTITCRAPEMTGTSCLGSGGTDPSNAFRVGPDGSAVPLPTLGTATTPIVPGFTPNGNGLYELLSFQIDPKRKVGPSHGWDFTLQRELPGNMLVEVGYVGRHSSGLYQGVELNNVPFFMTSGGQSFAEAFDAVAASVRTGGTVSNQPFFETILAGSTLCTTSCTAGLAASFATEFQNGGVFDLWTSIEGDFVTGPATAAFDQVLLLYMISDFGRSNYNAGFVTLRKRPSHGVAFDLNYTLSNTLDQIGINQQSLNSASNAFDLDYDYGPAPWDRRHIFNAVVTYDLPFGRGQRWSAGNWADRVIGGWYVSGLYSAASGLPYEVLQGTCQEWGAGIFGNCAGAIPTSGFSQGSNGVHTAFGSVAGSSGNPATNGTGLNLFSDPDAVLNSFRRINVATDTRGGRGAIRGLPRWNMDIAIGKETMITERIRTKFVAEFFNVFNHLELNDPSMDITNPSTFGVLRSQYGSPRIIQLGLRVEF